MKPRTVVLIAVGVTAAVILGSFAFLVLQQLFAGSLFPGEQTLELLQASPYPNLLLEVDHTAGDRPTSSALAVLEARLGAYTAKESIQTVFDVIQVNETRFSTVDLLDLERANRDEATGGDTFTLYILSISGQLEDGNGNALGAAYTASSLAIFKDVIRAVTGGPGPSVGEVEASVLVHELGHIMGLVNLVYTSDLDYEDPTHPFHSNNTTGVMFWAIESTAFVQPPNDFGSETRFDLQKLREGEYNVTPSRLRDLVVAPDQAGKLEDRWATVGSCFRWLPT
ncbi:MAG: hypothetical protein ACE5EW_03565 [Thermoplasmata archaeon]